MYWESLLVSTHHPATPACGTNCVVSLLSLWQTSFSSRMSVLEIHTGVGGCTAFFFPGNDSPLALPRMYPRSCFFLTVDAKDSCTCSEGLGSGHEAVLNARKAGAP